GDADAIAKRSVERLAERDRGVLRGVMRSGLEIAGALDVEVEPAVERELLEEMVGDRSPGLDAHSPGAGEVEPNATCRHRGRPRPSATSLTSRGFRSAATASAAESVETGAGDWRRRSSAAISARASA